jgi:hypothetical protein
MLSGSDDGMLHLAFSVLLTCPNSDILQQVTLRRMTDEMQGASNMSPEIWLK